MKHIALLLPGMRMGGAEKICLNFLDYLVKEYKVTMILSKKEGELLPFVPACVEIIEDKLLDFNEIVRIDIRKLKLGYLVKDLIYYLRVKTGHNSEENYRYLISRTPKRNEHYDCAIGYVANVTTQIFCLADRINADMKLAWIHGETSEIKDTHLFSQYYSGFDRIYAVSKTTRDHFIKRFPNCRNITDVYYNTVNKYEILEKAKEKNFEYNESDINIVTVGRMSPEKGMDMIPEIVERLVSKGHNIHWFIVGDGTEFDSVLSEIKKKSLEKYITMTRNMINPYPLMAACDIYVQPSYEEGYSTTICEAAILGRAIIGTTTAGGIREQVTDGTSALLAEPTPKDLAEKIEKLILDEALRQSLGENAARRDFSGRNEFEKFKRIVDGEEYAN